MVNGNCLLRVSIRRQGTIFLTEMPSVELRVAVASCEFFVMAFKS
jgi:hypothetical protein